MESIQIAPEIFNQGEVAILCFPFTQDPLFAVDAVPDRKIHIGSALTLKLNPKFNSQVSYQAAEACDVPFKVEDWNREVEELETQGHSTDVSRRMVLRKRYPLIVQVEDGVLYSPSERVICESLGKINFMKQQKIPSAQVFAEAGASGIPAAIKAKATIQEKMTSAIEAVANGGGEVALENLTRTESLHRVVPLFVNRSSEEEYSAMMTEGFDPTTSFTQGKPLTRFPSRPMRESFQSNDREVAGPSTQVPGPSRNASGSPPKRPRDDFAPNSQPSPPSHAEMMKAVETIQKFFNPGLMDFFNIPGDRLARNIPETLPDTSTLGFSHSLHQNDTALYETNTVKMGSFLFGQGNRNVNMFIYKSKNKFVGHQVPMSIREGGPILRIMVITMIDAMRKLAVQAYNDDIKAANQLEDHAKEEAKALAGQRYVRRREYLGDYA